MKVINKAARMYKISVKGGEKFKLLPASGEVELPEGYDEKFVNALAKLGDIEITEQDEISESEQDEVDELELIEEYEELSGEDADGRWSIETLQEKIAKLKA